MIASLIVVVVCHLIVCALVGRLSGLSANMRTGLLTTTVATIVMLMAIFHIYKVEQIRQKAVEEKAATWEVDPVTGKREFIWITDLFTYEISH